MIIIWACLVAIGIAVCAGEGEVPNREVIRTLLPSGMDPPSPEDVANRSRIQAFGPTVIPVLASLIAETSNLIEMSTIVDIAAEIPGDHSLIVRQMHVLLQNNRTKVFALQGLQRLGSANDARQALLFLSDDDEAVRINAAKVIQRHADVATLEKSKAILDQRAAQLPPEERKKDLSIQVGYCAVSNGLDRVRNATVADPKSLY